MLARILAWSAIFVTGSPWLSAQSNGLEPLTNEKLRPYYQHAGFSWKIERVPNFEFNYEADSEAERRLSQLKEVAERGRASILKLLGLEAYEPVIHVFFVSSIARMNELVGSEVLGRSRPTQHAVFCVVAPFSELSLNHELAHEISTNVWGAAEHWLEEGLANYVVDNNSSLMNRQCLAMLQSKQWIPLKKLVNPEWKSSIYSPDDTYPELGGFVQYLYETFGVARFQQVWKGGSKDIKKVFGKKLSSLEKAWRSSLAKRSGMVHDEINLPGKGDLFLKEEITREHRINP